MAELVKELNKETGSNLIGLYEDRISLNATTLCKIFQKYTLNFIKDEFHNNLFLQLSLTKLVQDHINSSAPLLAPYLVERGISTSDLKRFVNLEHSRAIATRGFDLNEIITQLVRAQLEAILSPIQSTINSVLEQVSNAIMKLYVSSESSNGFVQVITGITNKIVLQLAEYVTLAKEYVNTIVNNLIYGNDTTTTTTVAST